MVCDVCKERDAVVNLTQVHGEVTSLLRLCEQCAAERGVETVAHVRPDSPRLAEWRRDYNEVRPHSSLQDRTPAELAATLRANGTIATKPTSDKLTTQDSTK